MSCYGVFFVLGGRPLSLSLHKSVFIFFLIDVFSETMIKKIGHASPSSHKEASTSVSLCLFVCVHFLMVICLLFVSAFAYVHANLDFAVSFLFCSRVSVPLRINLNALSWELNFGDIQIVFLIKKMLSVTIFV